MKPRFRVCTLFRNNGIRPRRERGEWTAEELEAEETAQVAALTTTAEANSPRDATAEATNPRAVERYLDAMTLHHALILAGK
jgi:hypothetical protein